MLKILNIIGIILWISGLFAPLEYKAILWAIPSGMFAGGAIVELFLDNIVI